MGCIILDGGTSPVVSLAGGKLEIRVVEEANVDKL